MASHLSLAACLRSPGCKPQALGTEVPNRCAGCSSAPDPARHRHSPGPAATSGFCPGCSPPPWGQQRLRTDVWKGETQVWRLKRSLRRGLQGICSEPPVLAKVAAAKPEDRCSRQPGTRRAGALLHPTPSPRAAGPLLWHGNVQRLFPILGFAAWS